MHTDHDRLIKAVRRRNVSGIDMEEAHVTEGYKEAEQRI